MISKYFFKIEKYKKWLIGIFVKLKKKKMVV